MLRTLAHGGKSGALESDFFPGQNSRAQKTNAGAFSRADLGETFSNARVRVRALVRWTLAATCVVCVFILSFFFREE